MVNTPLFASRPQVRKKALNKPPQRSAASSRKLSALRNRNTAYNFFTMVLPKQEREEKRG